MPVPARSLVQPANFNGSWVGMGSVRRAKDRRFVTFGPSATRPCHVVPPEAAFRDMGAVRLPGVSRCAAQSGVS